MPIKSQYILLATANIGVLILSIAFAYHVGTYKHAVRESIREEFQAREQRFIQKYADQVAAFMSEIGVEGAKPTSAEEMLEAYLTIVTGAEPVDSH